MDRERYLRQILLHDVGEAGQRALLAAAAPVGGATAAHEVARLYAERAGFGEIAEGPPELDAGVGEGVVTDAGARAVLAGSRAAARAFAAAIGLRPGGAA